MSCAKIVPELVFGDLADERRIEPQRRRAGHAVRRRPAADLPPWPHRGIEIARLLGRQQAHRALGEAALVRERVVAGRDDVNDRIADRHDVEAGGSHEARG